MKTALRLIFAIIGLTILNGLAATPSRLFVALSQDGTDSTKNHSAIVAFDLDANGMPTQKESYTTVGVGDSNHSVQAMRVDLFGKFLFLPNNLSSSISVYAITADGHLNEVDGSPLPAGPEPGYVAVHPNGRFFYVSCWGSGHDIRAYENDSVNGWHQIQALRFDAPPWELAITPDGRHLYAAGTVTGGSGFVAFKISESGLLEQFSLTPQPIRLEEPWYVTVNPDGRHLLLLDRYVGGIIYRIEANGDLTFMETTNGGTPGRSDLGRLSITKAGQDVRLSWHGNSNVSFISWPILDWDWLLPDYERLSGTPVKDGDILSVTLPRNAEMKFFRLKSGILR